MPNDFPVMVVASSWWNGKRLTRPAYAVLNRPLVCDCGGFLSHRRWGGFPYSLDELADWSLQWDCDWCATPDWPCEPELGYQEIDRRIQMTIQAAAEAIQRRPDVNWYPVLQGWEPRDYIHCYELYDKIGLVPRAIGTLCRRGKLHDIKRVVSAIGLRYLQHRYHLFGVKLAALGEPLVRRYAASVDTAAWSMLDGSIAPPNAWRITSAIIQQHGYASRRDFEFNFLLPRYRDKCEAKMKKGQPALI